MPFRKIITLTTLVMVCLALLSFPIYAQAAEKTDPGVSVGTTLENLITAFNGESNANARYLAFAKKADQEGYGQVASLFRAVARAEQVHLERHAAVIKELGATPKATIETPIVKSTKENIEAAMNGEIYETTKMYPAFLAKAEKDKMSKAIDAFDDAGKAEAVHADWYKKALNNMDEWKGKKKDFYVCPLCGNVLDRAVGKCPICLTDSKKFISVS